MRHHIVVDKKYRFLAIYKTKFSVFGRKLSAFTTILYTDMPSSIEEDESMARLDNRYIDGGYTDVQTDLMEAKKLP